MLSIKGKTLLIYGPGPLPRELASTIINGWGYWSQVIEASDLDPDPRTLRWAPVTVIPNFVPTQEALTVARQVITQNEDMRFMFIVDDQHTLDLPPDEHKFTVVRITD